MLCGEKAGNAESVLPALLHRPHTAWLPFRDIKQHLRLQLPLSPGYSHTLPLSPNHIPFQASRLLVCGISTIPPRLAVPHPLSEID